MNIQKEHALLIKAVNFCQEHNLVEQAEHYLTQAKAFSNSAKLATRQVLTETDGARARQMRSVIDMHLARVNKKLNDKTEN